ncbi:MAG TPA: hypothetical protein VKX17_00750 [Planctomycetota bacterium]|nr:hypothetical protein [Planctomycetota bacterium]
MWPILILAALLEVGGDALFRWGLRGGAIAGYILGAAALIAYGVVVNLSKWDFGKLMGIYIAMFFVVSQLIAFFIFRDKLKMATLAGGALIVAGGIIMAWDVLSGEL